MKPDIQQDSLSDISSRIKNGDEQAFRILYDQYAENLLNFSARYVRSPDIAEDIVQDVFVTLWQNRERIDPTLSIKAYLHKLVLNRSLKHFRRMKFEQVIEDPVYEIAAPDVSAQEKIEQEQLQQEVRAVLRELPEKCRNIFELNRYHNLKYAEIAELMNISVNTVKTQMGRAFKALRQKLVHLLILFLRFFIFLSPFF